MSTSHRQVLLIVDDEESLLEALRDYFQLRAPEVELLTATNGHDALRLLRERPVDAILSDYRMPGMHGLELLEEVRRLAPKVPRVLMTAYADLDVALRGIQEAKVSNMFPKPLDPERLLQEIKALLDARTADASSKAAFSRLLDQLRRGRQRNGDPPRPDAGGAPVRKEEGA